MSRPRATSNPGPRHHLLEPSFHLKDALDLHGDAAVRVPPTSRRHPDKLTCSGAGRILKASDRHADRKENE